MLFFGGKMVLTDGVTPVPFVGMLSDIKPYTRVIWSQTYSSAADQLISTEAIVTRENQSIMLAVIRYAGGFYYVKLSYYDGSIVYSMKIP